MDNHNNDDYGWGAPMTPSTTTTATTTRETKKVTVTIINEI